LGDASGAAKISNAGAVAQMSTRQLFKAADNPLILLDPLRGHDTREWRYALLPLGQFPPSIADLVLEMFLTETS
jgi:hypothetical protein